MTLEPTQAQRTQIQNIKPGKLALVQFFVIKDQDAFNTYLATSERAVHQASGKRTHSVHVDQMFAGGVMPYQTITVDLFPSSEALLNVFDVFNIERKQAFSQIYALVVHPGGKPIKAVKALGFLSPIMSRILGTNTEKEMTRFPEVANPHTGPVPETVAEMKKHDQSTPFYMMNLNKYYPQAQYANGEKVTGEQAYNRYGNRIVPYLISVGGYPDIFGHPVGLLVGDENSPLHDDWSDFAMVYYPSRRNFIRMMSNSPMKGVHHRDAGLQRAVLMPSSEWGK